MGKRIATYLAIGALLAFGGCSGSSTGSGNGGNGGNEPSNSPMSVQTSGLDSELVTGQERQYGISVSDDDKFSEFDIEASLDGNTLWHKQDVPTGTSWDTTVTYTPSQEGTLTINYIIKDDFSGTKETEAGDKSAQVVGPINYTGTINASTQEDDSTFVPSSELESIVQFNGSPKDTVYAQAIDAQLTIRADKHNGERGFWMVPAADAYGNMQWEAVAKNTNGDEKRQTEALDVAETPEAYIDARVISSDDDQPVGRAYLAIKENQDGTWVTIDSLVADGGSFSGIKIEGSQKQLLEFGQVKNGKHYSTIAGRIIDPAGADKNLDVVVMNRDKYRLDDSTQPATMVRDGTFTIDELTRLHKELKRVNANGGYSIFNNTSDAEGVDNRVLRFGESSNDPLPNEVIIGQHDARTGKDLTDGYLNTFVDVYRNKVKPVLGSQAPTLTVVDTVYRDFEDMKEDKVVVFPQDVPGGDGTVNLHGRENSLGKVYKNVYIGLQSDDTMSDENRIHTSLEEAGAGMIWMGKQSPTQYLTKYESVVHNDANVSVNNYQPMDVKVGRWNRSPYVHNHMDFDGSRADEGFAQRLPDSWQ